VSIYLHFINKILESKVGQNFIEEFLKTSRSLGNRKNGVIRLNWAFRFRLFSCFLVIQKRSRVRATSWTLLVVIVDNIHWVASSSNNWSRIEHRVNQHWSHKKLLVSGTSKILVKTELPYYTLSVRNYDWEICYAWCYLTKKLRFLWFSIKWAFYYN